MERRYSEEEQARIIARAVELQGNARHGVVLEEIAEAAREAGVDPKFVRIAAEEQALEPRRLLDYLEPAQRLGLFGVAIAQMYTATGLLYAVPRSINFTIGLAILVGALFGRKPMLRALGSYVGVCVLAALLTVVLLLSNGFRQDLVIAGRQALALLLVSGLAFVAGHVASGFLIPRRTEPNGIRDRLASSESTSAVSEPEVTVRHSS